MNHLTESIRNFIRLSRTPGESNIEVVTRVTSDPTLFSKLVTMDNHLCKNPTMLKDTILQEEFIKSI